jgi:hypothetical protein
MSIKIIYTGSTGFEAYDQILIAYPKLLSAVAQNSTTVRVTFDTAMKHVSASNPDDCLNPANYGFAGSVALTATSVVHVSSDTIFDITVNEQTNGTSYTVTVSNVESQEDNLIDPAYDEATFSGIGVKPRVSSATALTNYTVQINFNELMSDNVELDKASNYTFDNGLTSDSVVVGTTSDYVVVTTLEEMGQGVSYIATVNTAVTDLANNALDNSYKTASFSGIGVSPNVTLADDIDATHVDVTFNETVDQTTAEIADNYAINHGYIIYSATKQSDTKYRLKIEPALSITEHLTVTVTDVEDLVGNKVQDGGYNTYTWDTDVYAGSDDLKIRTKRLERDIFTGIGSPEGVVIAPVGTIYLNENGGTNTTLYAKESGTGNTGWVAK